MADNKPILREAVDALQGAVSSSNTPYPLDHNVISVIPIWNRLLNAVIDEGRELYFTVKYNEAVGRHIPQYKSFQVTAVRGRFKEISNAENQSHATYKITIEDVNYVPTGTDIEIQPELKPLTITLYTWIELYEFLGNLILNDVTWEII